MLTNNKNTFVRWILSGILVVFAIPLTFLNVQAAEDCSDAFYIDETLPNGARWEKHPYQRLFQLLCLLLLLFQLREWFGATLSLSQNL